MNIQHYFAARFAPHFVGTGEVLWEVITPDGERVASTTREWAARDLEEALNMALTEWVEADELGQTDRVVNC